VLWRRGLRVATAAVLVAVIAIAVLSRSPGTPAYAGPLPQQLSDAEFWRLIEQFSEKGGYFRSDNFVSNERQFQFVLSDLQRTFAPGGVYLGVGPDQNFTYVVGMRPKIAFIVDIRRQNLLQHLMYKAIIEMSADRADFLSLLFSRPRPPGIDSASSPEELFRAYDDIDPDAALFTKNVKSVEDLLTKTHGFRLQPADLRGLEKVYNAFRSAGPDITYSYPGTGGGGGFGGGFGGRGMPSYWQLLVTTDEEGENRSYLGTEANFRILKEMQAKNLLVPLVGDFAGKTALRAVGNYLREHGATVSAFYTSNVEQYLFQQGDDWRHFYSNVATLPVDEKSTFIRSRSGGGRGRQPPDARMSILGPIAEQLRQLKDGRIRTYYDLLANSH
jgi:hypothetical protein